MERSQEGRRRPPAAVKLVVAYNGANFAGSQRQRDARTVQAELERVVTEIWGIETPVYLAGRTDGGVHAVGQVGSCADRRPDLRNETLRSALNAGLPEDLAVVSVERKPVGFHARHDAIWRSYRYRIWSGPPHPLLIGQTWQRNSPLLVEAMQEAAAKLLGTHDVAGFVSGGEGVSWSDRTKQPRGTVRTIVRCEVRAAETDVGVGTGQLIEVDVAADGFLPRMVRGIVGTLVEIGRQLRPPTWIDELLALRDRRVGAMNAPAHGLVLWRVGYAGDELGPGGKPPVAAR